jgi:hypothetical protein
MTVTIESLIADAERERRETKQARKQAQDEAQDIVDRAQRAGLANLTTTDDKRVDELLKQSREAADRLDALYGNLAELRKVKVEMAHTEAAAKVTHPTDARLPGTRTADDGPRWVRTSDMRPAVVARGQRFADHEIVQDHAARQAVADQAVIGTHGSFGNLVRSMTTTSGSAVVPTLWASDIIDRARNMSAVYLAGAQTVPMDAKVVQIGRLAGDPTAAF